ncbi:EC1118_1L7_1332p [Saccharomyces cerevisiae EC1118]|uniref:EC1118_1L7_1332p n=1 Tax=Saccharomyces cerevisiae (strain Lalvin EC1118 / Prise de mousse) TaxID=643680 RepID=C8ZDP3_YEAS8|nr:EC1118_1L7_1332p [Saccharomyces cerevisiae EC1118]
MVAEGPVAKRLISAILRYNYGMNPLGSLSSAKKRGHVSKIESLPGLSSRANLRRRTTRCRPERRRFYSGTVNRNARSAGAASRSTSSVKRPLESKKRNARPETEKWCASYSAGNRR